MYNFKSPNPIDLNHGSLNFDFSTHKGHGYALLGPNGSGKSSFFTYLKLHIQEYFNDLDVMFFDQRPLTVLGELRPCDLFKMLKDEFPERYLKEEMKLIDEFYFRDRLYTPIKKLSGGENQILKLISTFILKSDLYFLDEPTNNLDIHRLEKLKKYLKQKMAEGKTFLIIDHDINFIRDICDHVLSLKVVPQEGYIIGDRLMFNITYEEEMKTLSSETIQKIMGGL